MTGMRTEQRQEKGRATWPACEKCGKPVAPSNARSGAVASINPNEAVWSLTEYEQARQKEPWRKLGAGLRVIDAAHITGREAVPWFLGHATCQPDSNYYEVDGLRLATAEDALSWTFHLSEKVWFDMNTWERVVRTLFALRGAG